MYELNKREGLCIKEHAGFLNCFFFSQRRGEIVLHRHFRAQAIKLNLSLVLDSSCRSSLVENIIH